MSESLNQVRGLVHTALGGGVEGKVSLGPRSDEITWYLDDGRIATLAVRLKEAVELAEAPAAASSDA